MKTILFVMLVAAGATAADDAATDLPQAQAPALVPPSVLLLRAPEPPARLDRGPDIDLLRVRAQLYATDSKTVLGAALLELLTPVPGVGQMYAGSQWWKILVQYGVILGGTLVGAALTQGNPGGALAIGLIAGKSWGATDAILATHRFNADLKTQLELVPATWPREESWR